MLDNIGKNMSRFAAEGRYMYAALAAKDDDILDLRGNKRGMTANLTRKPEKNTLSTFFDKLVDSVDVAWFTQSCVAVHTAMISASGSRAKPTAVEPCFCNSQLEHHRVAFKRKGSSQE